MKLNFYFLFLFLLISKALSAQVTVVYKDGVQTTDVTLTKDAQLFNGKVAFTGTGTDFRGITFTYRLRWCPNYKNLGFAAWMIGADEDDNAGCAVGNAYWFNRANTSVPPGRDYGGWERPGVSGVSAPNSGALYASGTGTYGKATITTSKPSATGSTSATMGLTVVSDGGQTLDKGVIYSISPIPDNAVPGIGNTKVAITGSGEGAFSSLVTGLIPGRYYLARAYAINASGTTLGDHEFVTMPTPAISAPSTTGVGNTTYGTPSGSGSFTLAGANLEQGILISAPTGFEVSLSSNGTYTSTLTVGAAGNLSSTRVYVRLSATAAVASYSSSVVNVSSGPYAEAKTSAINSVSVSAAPLTIRADDGAKIYGQALSTGSSTAYTITSGTLKNGNTISAVTLTPGNGGAANDNVNTYNNTLIPSAATGANGFVAGNYNITYVGGNITVSPATLAYVVNSVNRIYGASNPTLTGTVTGFVNAESQATATTGTLTLSTSATTSSNVGNYAVNCSGLTANNGNYVFVQASTNATAFTISPATLTYIANYVSRTYGTANPVFTGGVTGFVNGQTQASATTGTIVFSSIATSSSNADFYAINGSGLTANNGNYVFVQHQQNEYILQINRATLTYVANAASRTYGTANPVFTGTVTGFLLGETIATATTGTLSFNSNASITTNVAQSAITGSGLIANNGNYIFVQASGNSTALTITPASLTYKANAANRSYGAADPTFTGTVTGFVNGQSLATATSGTLAFSSSATSSSNVGAYDITGSGLTANRGNYVFVQASTNATALTINPAALTYTANSVSRPYGTANPTFTGTATGLVNGETLATATTGSLSFSSNATNSSNVGTYAINGSGLTANNGNYVFAQAGGNNTALAITPVALTYTANAASRGYGMANPVFTGTLTGFALSDNQANATTGTLTFTSSADLTSPTGQYAINGSGISANNGNYTFAQASANATALTVTKTAQVINFAALAAKTYGDAPFALTATGGGSSQAITYISSNTNVATIVGNTVTIVGTGSSTITASQTGDAQYNAAISVDQTLTVNKATQSITFATLANKTYGDAAFNLTATGGASNQTVTYVSSNTNVATITGNTVTIVGAGNTTITASQLGDGNYNAATAVDQVLTVDKAAQTITFAALTNKTFGDAPFALSATGGASNQTVTYVSSNTNVATIVGNMVTIVGAGNTTITASQVGDANYAAATPVDQTLTVAKATQTITFTALTNKIYGDAAFALTATGGASNNPISYVSSNTNVATIVGSTVTIIGAGNTTITASQAGDANYAAATPLDQTLTVAKATQVITFIALTNKTYGDAAFALTATGGVSNQTITYVSSNTNVATIVGNMVTMVGAGSTILTASQAGDANYDAASPVDQTLTVGKAAQTITFAALTNKTYGDAAFALTATGGGSNQTISYVSSNTNVATIVGNMITIVGAGNTTITASQAGDANYNAAIAVDQTLTVGKAAQTINFAPLTNKIYGDVAFALNATGGGSNQTITYVSSNTNVATIVGNTVTIVGAGSTTITASQVGDANYNAAIAVDQTLTINKASQSITFAALTNKIYGDVPFALTATGGGSNQTITYVSSNTNVARIIGNTVTIVGAGSTTITASQLGDANYMAATAVDQVLTIDKAAQTITFAALTNKTYGNAPFALNATGGASNQAITYVSSNTNVATIVGNTVTIVGAGNTTITASQAGDANYAAASDVPQTLTIDKASQSIIFTALTNKTYGDAAFALSATGGASNQTITYVSSNTNVATIVGSLVTIVGAGNATITASQAGDTNYAAANPVDQVLTVGKAAQTISFAPLTNKIYGDAPFVLSATGGGSNQTITYLSSNTNVATIVGNTVTIVGAGNTTITAAQAGDANYNAASPVDQGLTVDKATQTITFAALANKTYNDAPFALTATGGGSNQTITYVSSNTNVATIVGNQVTIIGAGNTTITASQAGDGNYNAASPVDQALTVGKANQTITFTALTNKTYGDAAFTLNATGGGSNQTIAYLSSNTNVATIVGNQVTIIGAGNTTITASQAGDGNYNVASSVDQVLTVDKAAQTITFTTLANKTYGDAAFTLTATGGGSNQTITYLSSNTNVATIVGNQVTIVGAGNTTITASQAGDGNYNAASPVDQVLTVNKAAQSITFTALANKTYGDAPFALSATGGASNQPITYVSSNTNVATIAGNTVTIVGAGNTTITASQIGDANYAAATDVPQTLTINKASQSIIFTTLTNKTYGDAAFALSATGGASTQTITYVSSNTNVATIVGNTVTIIGAGNTTITASQAGDANYNAATPVDQVLTVGKAAQAITFAALANKTYNDVPFTLTATGGGSNQAITYVSSNTNVATIVGNLVTIVGAGSTTITASQTGDGNYNAASAVDQTLTVGKANQIITFTALTNKTYNDAPFALTATGGGSNQTITYISSNTSVATIVGNIVSIVGAGNTTITASQAGDGNYNAASAVDQVLTVGKANQTITFTALTNKTYGDVPFALTATGGGSNQTITYISSNTNVATIVGNQVTIVGAGNTTITASQVGNGNYNAAIAVDQVLTVNKAAQSITFAALANKTYGDAAFTLNATGGGSNQTITYLSSNTNVATIVGNLVTIIGAGNTTITASQAGDSNYTAAIPVDQTLTVNKAAQTLTFAALANKTYGDAAFTLSATGGASNQTITYVSSNTNVATILGNLVTIVGAGNTTITASQVGDANYAAATSVDQTLTVGKAAQSIIFTALTNKTYGDAAFTLSATGGASNQVITYVSSNTNVATIVGNLVTIVGAGNTTITASQAGDGNYNASSPVDQTLTVGKAAQVITFTALANKTYNDAPFALTATGGGSNQTITYLSSNTNVATIVGNQVTIVGAGNTTITASQAGDGNYNAASPVDQTLTVGKAAQVITFTALVNKTYNDAPFVLTATGGGSNQTITYVSSNTSVATIVGNLVTIVGAGNTTITASQAGDGNYNAATPVDQTLTVGKASQIISFAALAN
ncbi:S-layer family protein, partial [Pedobacter sp. Hv1]|uniref:beta strand repeat-containing protein n=1 Tax=Pedobacter sp. Hv1 TaxID=1740090 RepID=UPI0006D8C8D6